MVFSFKDRIFAVFDERSKEKKKDDKAKVRSVWEFKIDSSDWTHIPLPLGIQLSNKLLPPIQMPRHVLY